MPQICLRYVPDMSQKRPKYVQDISQISIRYVTKISHRYVPDNFQICPRYVSEIFKVEEVAMKWIDRGSDMWPQKWKCH